MTDRIGQHLGNYQLIQLLGQGHWASVYLGEHRHLHTQAAIKVLHGPWADSEVDGFLGEARTLARLRHPHIVRVLDFGVQEGTPFLVMEYAPGGTMRQLHPKGIQLPLQTVVSYVKQVASALKYAHAQRLIHRDLKPENLLLGPDQEVWLSDFGLAIVAHSARSQSFQQTAGTLAYMAPEQLQGHPTPASDQYALGVLVYEWLTGSRPFSGPVTELAVKQVLAPPPALVEKVPTLPAVVDQVVLQALAKDSEQRFASVQAFALALEEGSREDASGQTLPLLASGDPAEAGRKATSMPRLPGGTVTLLFTDIEGSTSLLQQVGKRYTQVLSECRRLLREAFHQYHGREVDTQGDAFFAAFARATDAVSAAVTAQRVLARHGWTEGMTVRVRMGLHTGEPELTPEGYVGLDVHHAARIMSAAHGGQILLSPTTRALVEHELPAEVSLRDLGEHRLKDLQRPIHLFQVVIADLPADFPLLQTLDNSPNNLPVQPTPLVGRVREVGAVCELMRRDEVCLLTLTGPGGIGKTRLGLQVAAELSESFAGGVFFVDLAPLRHPSLVLSTIAQTLGIQEAAGQSLLERLKEGLRQKQLLLLLDNFEQVLSAAAQVADLLAACPELNVLVTSRETLHVQAEYEFPVPALELPPLTQLSAPEALAQYAAVALFLERVRAFKPTFQLTSANARPIAEICVHLDGLPLAIELAAARIKLLPPQALLARLSQRLAVLTSGAKDAPARQQTLRNTIVWSYDLLDAAEQRLFRQLSVFVGGCTLEAVEAVCTAPGDGNGAGAVLDGVSSLIDKSLLQPIEQTEEKGEEPRFVVLETIREYGLEALEVSGEMEATRQAHALYYLRLAEQAEREIGGPQQVMWLERLEREYENLRAALTWLEARNEVETALQLAGFLWHFWWRRGHWTEGRSFLERLFASSQGVPASVRAKALNAVGVLAFFQSDSVRARKWCEEGLALFRELSDTKGIATCLYRLGQIAWMTSDLEAAQSLVEEALTLFREAGEMQGFADSLIILGYVFMDQGEYVRARSLVEESLAKYTEMGNSGGIATSLVTLARVSFLQGDLASAHTLAEQCLALSREVGDRWSIGHSLVTLAYVAFLQGEHARARSFCEEALLLFKKLRDREGMALSLQGLGWVAFFQADYATACTQSKESLVIAIELGHKEFMAFFPDGLAGAIVGEGHPTWAVQLLGASEAFREAINLPLPPVLQVLHKQIVATAHSQLGEQAFDAAWTEGRSMTLEQALAAQGAVTIPTTAPAGPSAVPHARKASTYPDGLTAREVEVLRLVAQGMTNEQIAKQLVISPRTVNTHLTSIFSKIGVSTRSAATRYAIDHHLI